MSEEIQNSTTDARPTATYMVENVVGCKWSLTVIDMVRRGIRRPGEMERGTDGLSTKVLNERLRKLMHFGILEKCSYPEIPPRVEYSLTDFGTRFARILDEIHALELPAEKIPPAAQLDLHTMTQARKIRRP